MVLKIVFIAAALILAACQSSPTPEASPAISPTPTLEVTPHWLETTINGITVGMWQPSGWETLWSDGLVIAEQTPGKSVDSGLLIYVFAPPIDQFDLSASDDNLAWSVLNQVIHMPSHTGRDLVVSQPTRFAWGAYDAAYYLLTTGDGTRALVLALAIPGQQKVIVCNISSPSDQADRIRALLPQLFDGVKIDGQTLSGAPLDTLPNPLPFPHYTASTPVIHRLAHHNPSS